MPEYLAPGVYVEEIDTGNKPIEGVSTSTAGMIGVTERGPVNVPILITGTGEFNRWFGGLLNFIGYSDPGTGHHCYLPHAVEGFFTNGGKRVYITRVLDTDMATRASSFLFDRDLIPPGTKTVLLRAMAETTGTAANPPLLLVLSDAKLAANEWIRIGDGSEAEYRRITVAPVTDTVAVPLNMPLSRSHAGPAGSISIEEITPKSPPTQEFTLVAPAPAVRIPPNQLTIEIKESKVGGAAALMTAIATEPVPLEIIEVTNTNISENRYALHATLLSPTNVQITLDSPLRLSYANNAAVNYMDLSAALVKSAKLDPSARAGGSLLLVDDRGVKFNVRTNVAVIKQANNLEIRRIGELGQVTFNVPISQAYPADTLVEGVNLQDDSHIKIAAAGVGDGVALNPVKLVNKADAVDLAVGQTLILDAKGKLETVVIQAIDITNGTFQTKVPLAFAKAKDSVATPVRALTAPAKVGASFIALDNRRGIVVGDVLRIGPPNDEEYVIVQRLPNRAAAGPDPGNVALASAISRAYAIGGTPVVRQDPVTAANKQLSVLVIDASQGADKVLVSDGNGGEYAKAPGTLRLTSPSGEIFYHRVTLASATPLEPQMVTLNQTLNRSHRPGAEVVQRKPLLNVAALDAGSWGNRLRVSVEDEPDGLVTATKLALVISPTKIRLASVAGVEAGTVLEFRTAAAQRVDAPVKVAAINRATGEIILDTPLTVAQQVVGLGVRSLEFCLTVYLLRQPDVANPARNETVLDVEVYRYLSMDPRHSRYVQAIIGTTWNDFPGAKLDDSQQPLRLSDRRPEGGSRYIRVRDWALTDPSLPNEDARKVEQFKVRLGPETLVDILSDGRIHTARIRLDETRGDDSIASLSDTVNYIGVDDPTPENRTGLQSLRNIEEISIVACPGRTSVTIQNALINHCELMRYRFTVLDAQRPPKDTLTDVQTQRQQFDTKYAALYHPWLLIPDPYPTSTVNIMLYPIPPSGHVVGVYARTDIERGVHKAPANELVRGITGLQRLLNKEEQDILNPYPVNINVIRDFRNNDRGIRVYGGRVITSDSDWKYVNVRRLLIFIEASIDRGLQWAVFEPNAEALWGRVRRSISNFLTLVWRNGGLEGTKPEEAYFVNCGRTTMTQTDIDSGRLIVVIGVAPVKPAEYVIIRIGLWTAHAED
ncbi:MAG: phage tail sheath C-terminal domain-containing protein [Methylococcaceae bacterium]